ncbi:unnamed protein product [Parascedosporium putredinis]|uniref:Carboxypeptidase n=1 Tax=Parascedosporium putredinis TaxID=1442378 RepID=A0A9P1H7N0_9PEZI|nr:unnamed protein product [Parascedosporium putredinis]CAI7998627.1 unnamed protein product [Parascedosporium putredinis]
MDGKLRGHYGPAFYRYFYERNEAIKAGVLTGVELELETLGIGNGIIDAEIQFPTYPVFAANNTYGVQALDEEWIDYMTTACYMVNGCLDQLWRCRQEYNMNSTSPATSTLCSQAATMCRDNRPAALSRFFVKYLNEPATQEALGIAVDFEYKESNYDVYLAFQHSGDYAYPRFLQDLEFLLDHGVRVLLAYGDADYIGNWFGGRLFRWR